MTNELHNQDLCPLCRRPLTRRTSVVVRSAGVSYPTRIDTAPHCDHCAAADPIRKQKWCNLMNARDES